MDSQKSADYSNCCEKATVTQFCTLESHGISLAQLIFGEHETNSKYSE